MFFLSATIRPRSSGSAFSLLELLAVIAITGILIGLAFGIGGRAVNTGRIARARAELAALAAALESYRLTNGDYPRTAESALMIQALLGLRSPNGDSMKGAVLLELERFTVGQARNHAAGPVIELEDPWGQLYRYAYKSQMPWSNPIYVLYSFGPDGVAADTLRSGGFPDDDAPANADNVHAAR